MYIFSLYLYLKSHHLEMSVYVYVCMCVFGGWWWILIAEWLVSRSKFFCACARWIEVFSFNVVICMVDKIILIYIDKIILVCFYLSSYSHRPYPPWSQVLLVRKFDVPASPSIPSSIQWPSSHDNSWLFL